MECCITINIFHFYFIRHGLTKFKKKKEKKKDEEFKVRVLVISGVYMINVQD